MNRLKKFYIENNKLHLYMYIEIKCKSCCGKIYMDVNYKLYINTSKMYEVMKKFQIEIHIYNVYNDFIL